LEESQYQLLEQSAIPKDRGFTTVQKREYNVKQKREMKNLAQKLSQQGRITKTSNFQGVSEFELQQAAQKAIVDISPTDTHREDTKGPATKRKTKKTEQDTWSMAIHGQLNNRS